MAGKTAFVFIPGKKRRADVFFSFFFSRNLQSRVAVPYLSDRIYRTQSDHMKNNIKPSFYYSAYPLKAIEQAVLAAKNGEPSPKLRALFSETPQTKRRIRVHSMMNSYKSVLKVLTPRFRKVKEIEPLGRDWFVNYE
jgi:hypothetical protein